MPDGEHIDDGALIERARSGEVDAFGLLYERYASAIFRYINARLPDATEAEDMTADLFLGVWRNIQNYEDRGIPFSAYLFRIAQNSLTGFYRKDSRRKKKDELMREHPQTVESTVEIRLDRTFLTRVLGKLPEDYRTVLELRFFGGLSSKEIAQIMERSSGAVRMIQYRALAVLRQQLVLENEQ